MAKDVLPNFSQYGDTLPGEDRSFGGNDFSVDCVPESAWFANLRSMIPTSQWKALSAYVRHRNHDQCEFCGSNEKTEAHERWLFDEKTGRQKLMRIMCLCKMCHLSVHIGVATELGFREDAEKHIFATTGWTKKDLVKHLEDGSGRWQTISKMPWTQDVSIVQGIGITIYDSDTVKNNIAAKRDTLAQAARKRKIYMGRLGWLDLSNELREGDVVVLAQSDEDTLDSIPLSSYFGYISKQPSLIREDAIQIPLSTFINAHNNPTIIQDKKQLDDELKNLGTPRRLIVKESWWVGDKMIADCFQNAILFSSE